MSSKFGPEFKKNWPEEVKYTSSDLDLLRPCQNIVKPVYKSNIKEICDNSKQFPIEFPIHTCRIISQPEERHEIIEEQVSSVYPLIHERVLLLYLKFLEHKKKYGTVIEKGIYSNMSLSCFIQRLLSKRCVSFFGKNDKYLLLNGQRGANGFTTIGTTKEIPPLTLENCLSYDEIKLSALLSISSHTEFLNDGNRVNCGKVQENKNLIERDGIIIGIIGARLSRRDLMEFQDIIISKTQNTTQNGYGSIKSDSGDGDSIIEKKWDYRQMWNNFYEEISPLFTEIKQNNERFGLSKNKNDIFDNLMMKKRYAISFDTLLIESETRANLSGKRAYIHVVGIGLGVWRAAEQQEKIFLECFSQRIKYLGSQLKHISFLHFSWFNLSEWGDLKNNTFLEIEGHPEGGIQIFISIRNPADKLKGPKFENCLLIVSYAWDGNALPGNEFWMNMLSSTGDPAAACSTLITELHNPHINKKVVCGNNLHIASLKYGVLHISDYVDKIH